MIDKTVANVSSAGVRPRFSEAYNVMCACGSVDNHSRNYRLWMQQQSPAGTFFSADTRIILTLILPVALLYLSSRWDGNGLE